MASRFFAVFGGPRSSAQIELRRTISCGQQHNYDSHYGSELRKFPSTARQTIVSAGGEKNNSGLSAEEIIGALSALSDELGRAGVKGEICLFGGAVMVLAFKARISTKDVDALFQPAQLIREAATRVGRERGLVSDWLNDGVKGFIASSPPLTVHGLPQFPNLHVTMPTAEYLLAMKCMAGRTGVEGADDTPDIIFLSRQLGLKSSRDVLDIVARYYGRSGVPVKTQYLVEGLFDEGKV